MHTPEIAQYAVAWEQVNMYLGKRRARQAGVVAGTFDFAFSSGPGPTCTMKRCTIVTITNLFKVVNLRVSRASGKVGSTGKSGYVTWFAWYYYLWNWSLIVQGVSYHPTFSNRKVLHYFVRTSKVGIDRAPTPVDNVDFR